MLPPSESQPLFVNTVDVQNPAPPKNFWKDDSPTMVSTMVSKCRILSIHRGVGAPPAV